jgi:multidrug efflux system membrane fusion protein
MVAAFMAAGVSLWLLSGLIGNGKGEPESAAVARVATHLTRVETRSFSAEAVQQAITVYGQSAPKRRVVVRAEISGRVAEVVAERGASVKKGDILLRLGKEDRPQRLEQARAALKQRKLEYQGTQSLKSKGLQAERQLAEAQTLLESARAALKRAQLDMKHLVVVAPFDGVLHGRVVEVGDYVSVGDPFAEVVELDPLVIRADVSENEIGRLQTGMSARAELSNGMKLEGRLTYIAPNADTGTRTYRVEVEAANPPPRQRGGMTATLHIPLETVPAHKVSPALLSLDDSGELGLKSVDKEGVVRFHPIEILKSERDGLWLGGLPERVELITIGQGFVRAGDRVEAVPAK